MNAAFGTMTHSQSNAVGWSPEKEFWDALVVASGDIHWRRVDLDLNRSDRVPRQGTGVYLICAHPASKAVESINAYTVLYAGQVKSRLRGLRTRFREHIRSPDAKLKLYLDCFYPSVHFWFALVNEPMEIDLLESLLIEVFNPPCNNIRAPRSSTFLARFGTPRQIKSGYTRDPA